MTATAEAKVRVLFVDDDANLLRAQRRMLRPQRDEWEMTFVDGGQAALEHMAGHPVDVLVTDMRMPGMDGAELLTHVSERHPGAIRVILSGFAEAETVARAVGISHQYLDKPCGPDRLIAVVRRLLKVRGLVTDTRLREFVAGFKKLPSPPTAYRRFMAEVENPATTTASLAAAIEADVGLSAKVLKLTNSAYFGLPARIADIGQAVKMLGLDTMRSLVAVSAFLAEFEDDPALAGRIETLSRRSSVIGALARDIMAAEGAATETQCSACAAGLLSHVGTLLLLANCPDGFRSAGDLADERHVPYIDVERNVFGATHAELGAYLLGLWGFDETIVEAVAFHHAPSSLPEPSFGVTTVLHVAQALVKPAAREPATLGAGIDMDHLSALGMADRLDAWREIADRRMSERSAA